MNFLSNLQIQVQQIAYSYTMNPTIVLISGANRGLGEGLLNLYLAKPNHVVIAANRDPSHATSKALFDLPTAPGSRLIVVKVNSSTEADPFEAVKELEKQGINHLDLVIANAGISYIWPKISELKMSDLRAHLEPNVFGVVWLFQATLPLLLNSKNPKWVTMGSTAGSIG
jgi:norsolorinic acid ketoreductase